MILKNIHKNMSIKKARPRESSYYTMFDMAGIPSLCIGQICGGIYGDRFFWLK